jgi:drug/metabolite transporter (DMT)-like permease
MALLQNTLPFFLLIWGTQRIDSALAAILNGTAPFFTLILAHFYAENDRLTAGKLLGLLAGFGGLLLLIAPSLLDGVWATGGGLLAVTLAAACFGIAIVYANLYLRGLPPLVVPTAQLSLATLYVLPLALFIDRPLSLPGPSLPSLAAWLALACSTFLAFILYYYIIERVNPSYMSMATYLTPVVGAILGVTLLQEQLHWNGYLGCALILAGVIAVNNAFKPAAWRQRSRLPFYVGE